VIVDQRSNPDNVQRFFLHYPEGYCLYVCVVDEKRRAFDFTDNTFKSGSKLTHVRDACLPAIGHYEPRAEHEHSYRVEIDLAGLLKGTNPETIPAEGAKVTVHWLRQVGDEPDISADIRLTNTVSLQNIGGRFQPADKWDADRIDENREFEKRENYQAEYRDFVMREIDNLDARRARLATAVRSGSVAGVLRVLAEDICNWAGNLKQHFLHQMVYYAKDPFFVRSRMVPKDSPFQVYEHWVVRDWIGSHEAYDLLEFHKSADVARSFSARLDKLHKARVEFSEHVVDYTVQTRGEDVEGVFVLDEARKDLKHRALGIAEYLDVIALQFEAADVSKHSPETKTRPTPEEAKRREEHQKPGSTMEDGFVLLKKFAAALGAYTGVLNQIIIEATHPEIDTFDDAIKWTTSRQADLARAHERIERLAGKELVAELVVPEGTNSEQWMVHLLSLVAESHNAVSYVFTSGPPKAKSDDLRAKMAASVVSRQLDAASNLVHEMESCRRLLLAAIQVRRLKPASESADAPQSSDAENSAKTKADEAATVDEPPIEPASDEVLRLFLPMAVMSAVGLRDLGRIRQYYPNVIPEGEARPLHDGFVSNLRSAAEICKLERVLKIGKIPAFDDAPADVELSGMMGVLALWHPDTKGDESASDEDVTKKLDFAITKCQEEVKEPVRGMIERVINAMLSDCRTPSPVGDSTFQEPQRFLQMLRMYWGIVRGLVIHHIEAAVGFRPHPLMSIVLNLKARMESCFDQLHQLNGCLDVRQQVASLIDIVLSGEPEDLQAAPEWSYDQVSSVDRFVEEGRLTLGAKSYPLTPAEEMCLQHAQDAVNRYAAKVKDQWSRMLKRIDAKRDQSARPNESAPTATVPSEPPPLSPEVPVSEIQEPQQFLSGEVVFYDDRVEICGVDICSGPRSRSRRVVLELLSRRKADKTFVAYSGEDLETEAKKLGAKGTPNGWIRDLRDDIFEALRTKTNLIFGREDLILSGGKGYRFAECLTVRYDSTATITDITDTDEPADVPNDDVRDVFDVPDDTAGARRGWVLQELVKGRRLKAPDVAEHFGCSVKTAQRDLTALKDEGKVEFVGAARTGFYRIKPQ
jgi:hypothetical protein